MSLDAYKLDKHFKYLLSTLLVICLIGLIMVYSASFIYAKEVFGSSTYYFYKQVKVFLISIFIVLIMYRTKVSFWLKYGPFINVLTLVLLILALVPSLGISVKGARRWLHIGAFSFQPGELVKYTSLIASVSYFDHFFNYSKREKIVYGVLLATPLGLLLCQPDFGGFVICLAVLALVCFFSHFPRRYFYKFLISGVLLVIPILIARPYRVRRLFAYLDPWKNSQTSGFQIIQSYLAFANGSIFGQGLGNSNEKLFYLPEAHNDFIFSVIGEELGFVGVIILVGLFFLILYFGFRIALSMQKHQSYMLVASVVSVVGFQAFLNMAVVLGLLPTKGLNLPFISAGGSSLMANFFAIGLVASAVRAQKEQNNITLDNSGLSRSYSSPNNYGDSSEQNGDLFGHIS